MRSINLFGYDRKCAARTTQKGLPLGRTAQNGTKYNNRRQQAPVEEQLHGDFLVFRFFRGAAQAAKSSRLGGSGLQLQRYST
jgi:hypothetical protein